MLHIDPGGDVVAGDWRSWRLVGEFLGGNLQYLFMFIPKIGEDEPILTII